MSSAPPAGEALAAEPDALQCPPELPVCALFPPSAVFVLIARMCHEARRVVTRALTPRRMDSTFVEMLATGSFNFYFAAQPPARSTAQCSETELPAAQLRDWNEGQPRCRLRFRLCVGMLALLCVRATRNHRAARGIVSRVASVLLSATREGLHHAALQYRASCDNHNAARCFSKAVEMNYGPAHAELSYMFVGCCTLQRDLPRALSLAEKGANLGCNDSKAALASCWRLMWMNEEDCVELAKESAFAGSAWGCSELGLLLQYGIGLPKNLQQASWFIRRAAGLGNAWARQNLGVMYATGSGVEKDAFQAAR